MLIKKIFIVLILTVYLYIFSIFSCGIDISAASAVVINADTKEIIYEKNAYKKRSMASTTKIMTSIIAIESGKLSDVVTADSSVVTEGTSIGLKEGYSLSLKDLVYGMMLESGNDAANLCAVHLGGNLDAFSVMMNDKAKGIGMNETNFVTPSGLDDGDHYSTAYDMAILGAYSVKNPVFRDVCSAKKYVADFISPEISVVFINHNKLLESCEGVFGIKTGFTRKSGRCLVTACKRDGATLVCVTMNAGDDWNDHRKLYDSAFAELNKTTFVFKGNNEISVYGSNANKMKIYCDDFVYHFKNSHEITQEVYIPKIIYAPVDKDEIIGKIDFFCDEKLIHTSYLRSSNYIASSEETYKAKNSIIDLIKNFFIKKGKGYDRR